MAVLQDAIELVNQPGLDPGTSRPRTDPGSRPPPAGRSRGVSHAAGGRHHRRLPGGIARADGHAAAAAPRAFLRSRRAGGDHPPRPDRRPDGASVFEPARRARAGHLRASVARADSRAHARRAAVSGAAAADGDGHRRLQRRPGRRAAPRVRLQAIGTADEAGRSEAARGHGAAGHYRRRRGADHFVDHGVCACTGFPNRTPPASRCWPMRARI